MLIKDIFHLTKMLSESMGRKQFKKSISVGYDVKSMEHALDIWSNNKRIKQDVNLNDYLKEPQKFIDLMQDYEMDEKSSRAEKKLYDFSRDSYVKLHEDSDFIFYCVLSSEADRFLSHTSHRQKHDEYEFASGPTWCIAHEENGARMWKHYNFDDGEYPNVYILISKKDSMYRYQLTFDSEKIEKFFKTGQESDLYSSMFQFRDFNQIIEDRDVIDIIKERHSISFGDIAKWMYSHKNDLKRAKSVYLHTKKDLENKRNHAIVMKTLKGTNFDYEKFSSDKSVIEKLLFLNKVFESDEDFKNEYFERHRIEIINLFEIILTKGSFYDYFLKKKTEIEDFLKLCVFVYRYFWEGDAMKMMISYLLASDNETGNAVVRRIFTYRPYMMFFNNIEDKILSLFKKYSNATNSMALTNFMAFLMDNNCSQYSFKLLMGNIKLLLGEYDYDDVEKLHGRELDFVSQLTNTILSICFNLDKFEVESVLKCYLVCPNTKMESYFVQKYKSNILNFIKNYNFKDYFLESQKREIRERAMRLAVSILVDLKKENEKEYEETIKSHPYLMPEVFRI